MVEFHPCPFRQVADDFVKRCRGRGGAPGAGHRDAGDVFHHRNFHIGRGQLQGAIRSGFDHHIGEDRDGVAAFHHALHMRERLEQYRPINGEFHRSDAPILLRRSQPRPVGFRGQAASEILPGWP